MSTTIDYYEYLQEQLEPIGNIRYRKMMGEYCVYYQDKVIGGIYDNRFLIKNTYASRLLIPNATLEMPYQGAKPMILVEELSDKEFLKKLMIAVYEELSSPKKK